MAKSIRSQKAEQLVAKFPNTGNSSLAEILFTENPLLYKDKEDARLCLRKARGANGQKNRKYVTETKHFPNGNPYKLPPEDHNNFEPLIIKTDKPIKIGILSDIHFPYQDNKALTVALDELKRLAVDIIILNGDISDNYMESDFVQDPGKRDMVEEVKIVKNFLKTLKKEFPSTRIIYKEGNHEFRHKTYLARKAPQVFGFEETRFDRLLKLKRLGIEWIDNKRRIEVGKLTVLHGHEFGNIIFTPVSTSRSALVKAQKSVLVAHHHQVNSHSTKTVTGDQHVAYSIGCLCDLFPAYQPFNQWSHGFAWVELNPDDTFVVHNQKIIGDKIL